MDKTAQKYSLLCRSPSDINEHLPTLYRYACECDSAFETGVRGCVSSWAILNGLISNQNGMIKTFLLNDITSCDIDEISNNILNINSEGKVIVDLKHIWENNLTMQVGENNRYDMTFIDTLHCYGQLRRELDKFSKFTNKYIIMHDTTIDEFRGEIYRSDLSYDKLVEWKKMTGFTEDTDILYGLSQAIDEFLQSNPQWSQVEKFTNNNGLTVLKKTPL